ncbi:RES domain-containing protein [Streptomyces nigrescens]|uniref:RES domain-containing protein n=1 Tax=Streptomyces nigrescens TaxID=1920 RepID=UPI003969E8CD
MHSSMAPGASDGLSEIADGVFKCPLTGLVVRGPSGVPVWRVHGREYGPLNPQVRDGEPDFSWSRFDSKNTATVYAAEERMGAFQEALDYGDRGDNELVFTLIQLGISAIDSPKSQWARLGHGSFERPDVPADWHEKSQICKLQVASGFYVDVCHPDTIGALRRRIADRAHIDPRNVDQGILLGPNRRLTCFIAESLLAEILANGSSPSGVTYTSRHGSLSCWALWVPIFDVHDTRSENMWNAFRGMLAEDPVVENIDPDDPDLLQAAQNLGLRPRTSPAQSR